MYFQRNTFVYYLTSYCNEEPGINSIMEQLRCLEIQHRKLLWRVYVICLWAAKDVTLEDIETRLKEGMSRESIVLGDGGDGVVVVISEKNQAWTKLWSA